MPEAIPAPVVLAAADFDRFREFFYHKTGIDFEPSRRYFVDRRLLDRMQQLSVDSFRDYFILLREGDELEHLINAMTVNESYFFREDYQFRSLVDSMLPELLADGRRTPIRIWSLPCASGEEPYSIALYLMNYWPGLAEHDIELLASDIDTRVLATARQGIYSARAVQALPKDLRNRHFSVDAEGRYTLHQDVRDCVAFSRVNIVDTTDVAAMGPVDIIFCRNLLIYFGEASRRIAAAGMYEAMRPGGFLCLGHSESMSRISALFKVRKFPDAIVYQKGDSR